MATFADSHRSFTRRRLIQRVAALGLALPLVAAEAMAPTPAMAVPLVGVAGKVNAPAGLNLRTGPGTSYGVIRTLPHGTSLAIGATSSDWFKVTTGGRTGWVNSWYVTLVGTPSVAVRRGNANRKMIALTFDAGSDLGYTERIVTLLERYAVPASFGLTGAWLTAFPDYAKWIAADGFQLINHTLNHPSYTGFWAGRGPISPAKRLSQLVANEAKLRSTAGAGAAPYWRPPYGDYDAGVLRDVGAAGYSRTILWTVDSLGWNGATADQIVNRVLSNAGNGAIVLMHVGSASQDAAALERIVASLRGGGYALGTVAQTIAP